MTRAEEILLKEMRYIASISNGQVKRVADGALASVSEYLATEPSGERAGLVAGLRDLAPILLNGRILTAAADMLEADASLQTQLARRTVERDMAISMLSDALEADAQPKQVTCQIYGHVVGACVECNTHIEAQQAKRVPLSDDDIDEIALDFCLPQSTRSFARAIEAHHGINAPK